MTKFFETVTKPTRPACRVFRSRPLRSRGLVLAGIGVKGDPGGRTRSAARRASTERVRMSGEAFTLDADGGHRAYRQGGGQGQRPQRLPPQTVGQEPTRDATEAVAQAKRGGVPAGDRLARSRQIRCRQKETPPKRG